MKTTLLSTWMFCAVLLLFAALCVAVSARGSMPKWRRDPCMA